MDCDWTRRQHVVRNLQDALLLLFIERQALGCAEAFSDSLICPVELSEALTVKGRPHPDRKKGVRSRQVRLISGW